MIRDDAIVSTTISSYGKLQIVLTEPQYPDCEVTITGVPEDTIVVRADAFKSPDSLFNGSKGECKRADFIVVANDASRKVVLYIELKKRTDSSTDIVKQLKGARCLVEYCKEVGREFWGKSGFLCNCTHRFIAITQIRLSKQKTRIKKDGGIHDRPDNFLKVSYPNNRLEFNRLVG